MASRTLPLLITLSLLFLTATAVSDDEISAALSAMRSHPGYSLFANAVATSDLYYSLLFLNSTSTFTLFAPVDTGVYNLDMSAASADDYVYALRRHVVPRRLSLSTLRSVPSGSNLPTLEAHHPIHLQTRLDDDVIVVDGVEVVFPGLFYSPSIAVHGLGGIINRPRRQPPPPHSPPPPPPAVTSVPPSAPPPPPRHQPPPPHSPPPPPVSSDPEPPSANPAPSPHPIISDQSISTPPEANSEEPSANSPEYADSPMAAEISPASMMSPGVALDCVSTEREVMMSHVIVGRGNTYRLEQQSPPTCPYS